MKKGIILWKGLRLSIKVQGIPILLMNILGFVTAILPIISAKQLSALTNELAYLSNKVYLGKSEVSVTPALHIFFSIIVIYIANVLLRFIQNYSNTKGSRKIQRYISETILYHKCHARYKYIDNYDDFHKKLAFINDYGGRKISYCFNDVMAILQNIITFIIAGVALWVVSPLIVIIIVLTSIPATILSYKQQDENFRYRAKWFEEGSLAIHYYNMIGAAWYAYHGLQEIRHFGLFDYLKARWRSIADEYLGKKNKIMKKHLKYNALADFLRSAIYLVILLLTAWKIYQNPLLGIGTFTLVYTLSSRVQSVTGNCFVSIISLVQSIQYMKEFFYIGEIDHEPSKSDNTIDTGSIEFTNVSFAYPNTEKDVLKNININIKNGEKIAVVGDNGSGKTTFINLLCGMYDPREGQVLVDGKEVASNLSTIRNGMSIVFQDFAHYESTLRENITISDKERLVSDEELMKLLKRIQIDDMVTEQKNGLDEQIGAFSDKGNNLSGGQWQKIAIARAAYRNKAKIMILDEPTAALDPMAEAQLYRNFTSLTEDKTTLLISHRLGITSIVDRILVFKDGQIIEDGSHHELMKLSGYYAKMYQAQAQWYM